MTKKLIASLTALLLLMSAAHVALAQTPAPNNDPGGGNTGTIGDLGGSGGSYNYPAFQVSAPSELSADDKKDTNKVAAYNDAKKAFDDYTAQAKAEPLAVKMADAVGHNRISINFVWTLVTGFLVMFMQAGFALVETGLVPRQERLPHHDHEHADLSAGHVGFLGRADSPSCSAASEPWAAAPSGPVPV